MEENKTKIFWKPIDGEEFKELKYVGKVECLDFETLEEPIDIKYDPTSFTKSISFDVPVDKRAIRKLCYTRVPRKKKKWQKKQVSMIDGKPIKHLRYDYLGCYYWVK